MQRCIQLALCGNGTVAPNPMVGSVIVHNGKIIGEGFHQQAGRPHAEVNAIDSVKDKSYLSESVLYVNLEPCNHTGKTPPCTELIIKSEIPEVIIGMKDPDLRVNGNGIQKLREAGIKVQTGILEDECKKLNRRFICVREKNRPYIILKWAQSADGFTGQSGKRINISNKYNRIITHKWRAEEQAILAGSGTVLNDNPELNVRYWTGKDPVRILTDRNGVLHDKLKIFSLPGKTIVYSSVPDAKYPCETIYLQPNNFIHEMIMDVNNRGIQSILVEGGSKLHSEFINLNLWDEARVTVNPGLYISEGVKAVEINKQPSENYSIEGIFISIYYNR